MHAVLANYTLSMMRGGGETRDLSLARELTRLGVEVELLTVQPLLGRIRHPVSGMPVRYLRAPYFRDVVYRLMQVPKAGRLAAYLLRQDVSQFSRRVVELLANPSEPADVLQAAGLYPVVELKRRRAIPVVIRSQGGRVPPAFERYVPLADAIVGDGWDSENFQRSYGRELVEIPGGVDLELFHPVQSELRQQLNLGDAEVILYVGRFAPLKNVGLLLDAFAQLAPQRPRARLVLVGEGALEGSLKTQARRLGIGSLVVFRGARPLEKLPAYYSMADGFALPSSFDNSPNVLLEAMACELPIVATRVGGVPRYVVDGQNGLLVEPGDPAALAAALARLLSDADLRRKLVAGGRKTVRNNRSWSASAARLLELYRRLTAEAGAKVGT
jgi:glycosyltransferase involved in cell wall biosynthesis